MTQIPATFDTAVRLHQGGQLAQAEQLYGQILGQDPNHCGALHLLGVLSHQRGQDVEATELIARAISLKPSQATYHSNYGVALLALGRLEEASAAFKQAIRLSPDYADAYSNLGLILHRQNERVLARACFETAVRLNPDQVDSLFNLANLFREQGYPERAIPLYRRAAEKAPNRADIHNNLGNSLLACEERDEAIASYRQALSLDPNYPEALINLAVALEQEDLYQEARACLATAARCCPDRPLLELRVAALCPAVFRSAAAIAQYRADLERTLDRFQGAEIPWNLDDLATAGCMPSFNLAHHGFDDRRLRTKFASVFRQPAPLANRPSNTARRRIGFVVTHPHEGVFLRCTAGLISRLDPERFQMVVFCAVQGQEAIKRAIVRADASIMAFPDRFPAAVEQIKAARCDLLYHWEVGTDPFNYFLPFARCAPVQCTSWGIQVTTGVPAVDYYISSALVEVAEADSHYSERLVRLPSLLSYQTRASRPNPAPRRAEFGLPRDAHLYACLQRVLKLHPDFDQILAGILRRDPQAVVVLLRGASKHAWPEVHARHEANMPDVAERVIWLPQQSAEGYHRLLSLSDVVLDPFPYGVGSSAYDIFSHDLPLVTMPGQFNASRYARACYRKMHIADLVARSPEHYVETAVRLGTDHGFRDDVRLRLAAATESLFEDRGAVAEHERFFERAIAAAQGAVP